MTYYVDVTVSKSFDSEKAAEDFAAQVIAPIKGVDYKKDIRYVDTNKFHQSLKTYTFNTIVQNPIVEDTSATVQKITRKQELGLMDK